LPQRQELAYASRIFPSVEINGTFYSLQTAGVFRAVVSRNAARLRVRREGQPLYHAHAEAAQRRGASRELSSLRFVSIYARSCYFDNDAKVQAPFDAANQAHKLGVRIAGVPGLHPPGDSLPPYAQPGLI
jgi:uncharacterized protein YecE (DUF72 family)